MIWKPHPKQEFALQRSEFEILYGGSRGGGKTDAGLVFLTDGIENRRYRALVIRKNADDLSDWVSRAIQFYSGLGANVAYRPAIITFPSGAVIRTGHLKDDQAYTKYQGHEYQRMVIEELTQIPDEKRYLQLLSSCRSILPGIPAQIFCTTNPGGVGHGWVKKRFVDPSPPNTPFLDKTSGRSRIFIPAKIDDNPTLMTADPSYVKFLDALKDTDIELWKAWRMGDWNTFAGQYFSDFKRELHTTTPFEPLDSLPKFGGIDWGMRAPFVFLAGALQKVKYINEKGEDYKFNRVWIYREISGTERTPQEWSGEIIKCVVLKQFDWIRGDPAMFHRNEDGSRSIADQFQEMGVSILPANNDRIGGWTVVKNWLSLAPDGLPYLIISEQCNGLITTLPDLVHDEKNVEDVDTDGPDHHSDALRYLLVHLDWIDANVGTVSRPQPRESEIKRFVPVLDVSKFR